MSKILFLYPNINSYGLTPIGISVYSALLKSHGHIVELFDTTFIDCKDFFIENDEAIYTEKMEQLMFFQPVDLKQAGLIKRKLDVVEELRNQIESFEPDIIAFSFWSSQLTGEDEGMMYERGKKLLLALKIDFFKKGINVVVGGIQASIEPEKILDENIANIVCVGEGEYAYLELANKIDKRQEIINIKNLWIKEDERIYKNELRPLIRNLDELPFADFDLFEDKCFYRPYHGKIVRGVDYELTRGCTNRCSYCVGPYLRDLYGDRNFRREKSIDRIIAEISYLKEKYNLDIIRYQDELFLGMKSKKLKILSNKYKEKVNLPFIIESSINTINKVTVKCLKKMGCLSVSMGVEHGNENFRERILNKFYTNQQAINAFRLLKKNGISCHAYSIMGFPEENRELIFDTIRLLKYLKVSTYQVSIFQPFIGTKLRNYCLEKKYLDKEKIVKEFVNGTILQNQNINESELYNLQKVFTMYVFSNEIFWSLIKIAEKNNFVYNLLRKIFQFVIDRRKE